MSRLHKGCDILLEAPFCLTAPALREELAAAAAQVQVDTAQAQAQAQADAEAQAEANARLIGAARIRAHMAYEQERRRALADGYRSGYEKGCEEARRRNRQTGERVKKELEELRLSLENQYREKLKEVDEEAVAFAFGLAGKIFNLSFDKNDANYTDFLNKLKNYEPENAPNNVVEQEDPAEGRREDADETDKTDGTNGNLSLRADHVTIHMDNAIDIETQIPRFTFDDLLGMDDEAMRLLLSGINLRDILIWMRGGDAEKAGRLLVRFPQRIREAVESELEFMGPVSEQESEQARRRIAEAAGRILSGKIKRINL